MSRTLTSAEARAMSLRARTLAASRISSKAMTYPADSIEQEALLAASARVLGPVIYAMADDPAMPVHAVEVQSWD